MTLRDQRDSEERNNVERGEKDLKKNQINDKHN